MLIPKFRRLPNSWPSSFSLPFVWQSRSNRRWQWRGDLLEHLRRWYLNKGSFGVKGLSRWLICRSLEPQVLRSRRTNEKDNSFKPMITKNKSKDEENDAKDNSDTSNDVDEMFNFLKKYLEFDLGSEVNFTWAMGESPESTFEARAAIRPMTVLSPHRMTIPRAEPSTQLVEKNAKFFASRTVTVESALSRA